TDGEASAASTERPDTRPDCVKRGLPVRLLPERPREPQPARDRATAGQTPEPAPRQCGAAGRLDPQTHAPPGRSARAECPRLRAASSVGTAAPLRGLSAKAAVSTSRCWDSWQSDQGS